ncbi:MAG: Rha family transcriptional regulator [Deltaproteobacteria bacterium]|nr:Rha family transcriptional regulator [Deltaproteobacteria bacterium]
MTNLIPSPNVTLVNGLPSITSLQVAEYFGKQHKDVLRHIRRIISECEGVRNSAQTPLFEETTYIDEQNGQTYPMFIIFFDGFMLLAMGYTGKKAFQIKLVFIAAFHAMENQLTATPTLTALPSPSDPITPDQQCTIQAMVRAITEKGGHHAATYSRFNNHFRIAKYNQLPQSRMSEAIDYLMKLGFKQKELPPKVEQAALPSAAPSSRHREIFEQLQQRFAKINAAKGSVEHDLRDFKNLCNEFKFNCASALPGKDGEALSMLVSLAGEMAFIQDILWIHVGMAMSTSRYLVEAGR